MYKLFYRKNNNKKQGLIQTKRINEREREREKIKCHYNHILFSIKLIKASDNYISGEMVNVS